MSTQKGITKTQTLVAVVLVIAIAAALAVVISKNRGGEPTSGLGEEFDYSLEALRNVDPSLIIYDEAAVYTVGLEKPAAVAIGPNDTINVAGDRTVRRFTSGGDTLPDQVILDATPTSIAIDDAGTIYLGMTDHVEVYHADGRQEAEWDPVSTETRITSIALSGDDVFLADYGNREVIHYKASGKLVGPIGDFVIPSPFFDVAAGPDKTLHAANTGEHRIEVFGSDGNLATWWGAFSNTSPEGFSGCCNPCNFALLPDGSGYVTCEKGLTRVKIYDMSGALVGFVAAPGQFAEHDARKEAPGFDWDLVGLDVAVDSTGRIVILDRTTAEIRIFTRKADDAPPTGEDK